MERIFSCEAGAVGYGGEVGAMGGAAALADLNPLDQNSPNMRRWGVV